MICFEGRNAYWKGMEVVILSRMSGGYVKVARRSNTRMVYIVKRTELQPDRLIERILDWLWRKAHDM